MNYGNGRIPRWKQLCEAAILEPDPAKLLLRVVEARSAVLDQIEPCLAKPSDGEQLALRDALEYLRVLREVAEREMSDERKTNLKPSVN
jgi:hypothetical protein